MADTLEYVHSLCPVTALSFLDDQDKILLSGEGPILKVFSVDKQAVLATARVFRSQAIHGIVSKEHEDTCGRRRLVVWGGFRVRIVHLVVKGYDVQIHPGPKLEAPGWVLDGRFQPPHASEAGHPSSEAQAALVTARNALLLLRIPEEIHRSSLDVLSGSRHSILYSAHVRWTAIDRLLLASGTVFGEIIVWSCVLKQSPERPVVRQHQILRGHEGSVFGVNLSEQLPSLDSNSGRRLLASCSDDRTIRVWDISTACSKEDVGREQDDELQLGPYETGFQPQVPALDEGHTPKGMLAMAWGHVSRIWGVRFVRHDRANDGTGPELLSFGEDATCQQWRLSWSCKESSIPSSCSLYQYALEHQSTKSFHAGRNIWSMAIANSMQTNVLVATGGADGKIACFILKKPAPMPGTDHCADTDSSNCLPNASPIGLVKSSLEPESQVKEPSLDRGFSSLGKDQNLNVPTDREGGIALKATDSGLLSAQVGEGAREFKFLRSYSLIDESRLLAITDAGGILVISCRDTGSDNMTATLLDFDRSANVVLNQSDFTYVEVTSSDAFKTRSIISTCRAYEVSFLAAADGAIYYFLHKNCELGPLGRTSGKVSYMLCQDTPDSIHLAISCLHSSALTYWTLKVGEIVGHAFESLSEPSRQIELLCNVVITSMAVLDSHGLLILGSRTGAVLIYDFFDRPEGASKETVSAAACFKRIHSQDAVTSISSLPNLKDGLSSPSPLILTTGRNGTYAIHEVRYNRNPLGSALHIDMITVHELSLVVCPKIEGAYINKSKHLVMFGFLSKHFIVWNESTQSEILRVECGGAHRIWNYLPTTHGGNFAFTKASKLYIQQNIKMSHHILQHGRHGRETTALSISPLFEPTPGQKLQLLATGSEDTYLQISTFLRFPGDRGADFLNGRHWTLVQISKHTTGVQALQWSPCGRYLFSSGGCEEFFVWRVWPVAVEGVSVNVICEAICPKQSAIPDTRITSFCTSILGIAFPSTDIPARKFLISMAYSNSFVRVFAYDRVYKSFTLLLQGSYGSCSISGIHYIFFSDTVLLCTTGSDGYLVMWDITKALRSVGILTRDGYFEEIGVRIAGHADKIAWQHRTDQPRSDPPAKIAWQQRIHVHQSSVKCLSVISVNSHLAYLITGGDDNAVALSRFVVKDDKSVLCNTWIIPRAHAGSVTAVARLPFSRACCVPGPDTDVGSECPNGAQLHRYRFATIGADQKLSIWHLTISPDHKDDLLPCLREHANFETSVADVSGMDVMEYLPGGPGLVLCGVGHERWRVRDLTEESENNCPYRSMNKDCVCATKRILHRDRLQSE